MFKKIFTSTLMTIMIASSTMTTFAASKATQHGIIFEQTEDANIQEGQTDPENDIDNIQLDTEAASTSQDEINEEDEIEETKETIKETAVYSAYSKIGKPYSQARRDSGSAYDCSSMVFYSYLSSGVNLSYGDSTTAADIAKGLVAKGQEIAFADLEKGDLVFYSSKKNGRFRNITHVAMYIGDGKMIHASSAAKATVEAPLRTTGIVAVCRPVV